MKPRDLRFDQRHKRGALVHARLKGREFFVCSDILISMKLMLTYIRVLHQMREAGNRTAAAVEDEAFWLVQASRDGYNFRRSFVARVHRGEYHTPFMIEWRGLAMATAVAERVCGDDPGGSRS